MWRGDESPYEGRHYQLVRPLNSPNSVQRPHPPILIGGSGERKTLRMVAQYADACNLFDIQGSQFRDDLTRKLGVLREHCAQVGRDFAEIEKTVATSFDLGEDPKAGAVALLAHLRELAEAGISYALVAPEDARWCSRHCHSKTAGMCMRDPEQGGVPQVPLSQNGFGPGHTVLHLPQLRMSFMRFTQLPLQQVSPKPPAVVARPNAAGPACAVGRAPARSSANHDATRRNTSRK